MGKGRRIGIGLFAVAALSLLGGAAKPGDEWHNYGGDGREQHFSPLDQVNRKTIDRLSLAWHFDLEPGFTATAPVVAEGKLFITTGHSLIRAFDARNGRLLWQFDAETRTIAQSNLHMSWGNRGIAYWNGRVFLGTTDGRVIALDARNGAKLWEERQYGLDEVRNNNGPPRVFDGKVIVGHGGADITALRGYVTAYDAMTGKQVWRFHTVPGDPSKPAENRAEEVMRPTWKGDWFGKGGGGTAWNAFSHDAELGLIYIGVGNGFPYNQKKRSPGGGDNLFLASVVAVDAETGEYRWHYQVCPAEQWDCTATQDMTLAEVEIGGRQRKVLLHAPKNGFLYALDRATGEFISAGKIAKVTWAERIDESGRPVENPGIRFNGKPGLFELWPGPQGAHSWPPQAFSPQTGLVYVPIIEIGALIGEPQPGAPMIGGDMGVTLIPDAPLPGSRKSFLRAWNPATQQLAWEAELPGVWPGGVLATSGGLVFQGRIDGHLVAHDAATGEVVWKWKTISPIVAPPVSYRVGGKQYITVLTGSGSQGGGLMGAGNAAYRTDYALPRQVLTFALGGRDNLPDFAMPELVPMREEGFAVQQPLAMKGMMDYSSNACLVCHGMMAIGAGAGPDLRYSAMILDAEAFKAVVKGGALKQAGMPPSAHLSDDTVESIRYYLRAAAMEAPVQKGETIRLRRVK